MTIKGLRAVVLSLLVGGFAAGACTGCASLGLSFGGNQQPFRGDDQATSPPQSQSEGDTQATLAAVDRFLERTKDYQVDGLSTATIPQQRDAVEPLYHSSSLAGSRDPVTPSLPVGGPSLATDGALANAQAVVEDPVPRELVLALPVLQSISIHLGPQSDAAPSESPKVTSANEPLDMGQLHAPMLVDELLAHLTSRAAEAQDLVSEWRLRMTEVAFERETEPPEVSRGLPEETRGLLSALTRTAAGIRAVVRDPSRSSDSALEWLDQLREALMPRASLTVRRVALCRKVVTFGVYEELDDADFTAGRTLRAIVYSEIRNFQSKLTEDGHYRTELATRLEVLTANGQSVWLREEPEIVDLCRERRNDFFIAQRITLPPTLPADAYVLKVLVEDKLSGKMDEEAYPFTVRSTVSVANGG